MLSRFLATLLLPAALLAQPTPTVRVATRLVYVDVVVRDAAGHVIPGLKQGDFRITEDGAPQAIQLFVPHTASVAAPAPLPTPANPLFTTNRPSARGTSALNLLLFDFADTPVLDQPYARNQMIRFLTRLPPGQQLALYVLSDRLHMLQGFTGSSDLLAAAARLLHPREMHLTDSRSQQMRVDEDIAYFEQGAGGERTLPDFLAGAIRGGVAELDRQQLNVRSELVANAFAEIARSLAGLDGRKNLLWLSGAFPIGITQQLQVLTPRTIVPLISTGATAPTELARILADSQIAVYPISVFGVETDALGSDVSGLGTAVASNSGNPILGDTLSTTFQQRQDLHEVMNSIANATGGRAIYGTNDLAGALTSILSEGSGSYTLAYQPTNSSFDGRLRQIRVSLPGRGASLNYRHSYLASPTPPPPTAPPSTQLIRALQPGTPLATALALSSNAVLPTAASPQLRLASTLDARNLDFTTTADGHHHARLGVLLAAFSAQLDPKHAPPQTSGVLTLDLDPAQYRTLLAEGLRFEQQLPLTAGTWVLRLGVVDLGNNQIGTLDLPVHIP